MWAKRIREQAKVENEAEDAAFLEKEQAVRQRLRGELRERLNHLTVGAHRQAVEQALHCLDVMEARRQRHREETFMLNEAFDSTKANVGEEIINRVMVPK